MAQTQTIIPATDLIAMDTVAATAPLRVDLVYAQAAHPENLFGEAIYAPQARLWLHRDLADIVLLAARNCFNAHGLVFVLKDGLRPVEAQEKIVATAIVRANPHWLAEATRMFALPGHGGHPRGMAIDLTLETATGQPVDMGTPFDYMPSPGGENPARRDYPDLSDDAKRNRKVLEDFMVAAAGQLNRPLFLLPSEWWHYQSPKTVLETYAPVRDRDLPPTMRMM